MTVDGDERPRATARAARRRTTVLVLYYLALGVLAGVVGLVLVEWLAVGLAVALGVHVLMYAPVFALRGHATFRTDREPTAVREELSSPENPLTALWFDAATTVEERDGGVARLLASGRWGLGEREWVVGVQDGDTIDLEIRRDGTLLVAARVAVEAADEGSRVTVGVDRVGLRPMTLLTILASEAQYVAHFAAHGYTLVDETRAIGLSAGRGREPHPALPTDGV